ncbi:MAG TPA: hypothetical protein VN903_22945, partial [Polyangia bacterium]|nr:hypothetical protein [Polyangia bacterium]
GVLVALASATSGCSQTDDRSFAWGYIAPAIFEPSCATSGCHSRAVAVAGLDFSDPDRGYASLTAGIAWVPGTEGPDGGCHPSLDKTICPGDRALVVPYDPPQSRVVNMLRARAAPRMPPDRPLPEADIRLVERWILDGARRFPDQDAAPPLVPTSDAATAPAASTDAISDGSTAGH